MLGWLKRRYPLLHNLRPGQALLGGVAALVVASLWRHQTGVAPLDAQGLLMRAFALVFVLIGFVVALQNAYRFNLVPDYSLKCRYCNGPVNSYSEFCEHCGADLIDPEKLVPCPKCGIELVESTKHCPECGARQKGNLKGGKRARREPEEDTASVGWSTPVDALSGFPPEDERR